MHIEIISRYRRFKNNNKQSDSWFHIWSQSQMSVPRICQYTNKQPFTYSIVFHQGEIIWLFTGPFMSLPILLYSMYVQRIIRDIISACHLTELQWPLLFSETFNTAICITSANACVFTEPFVTLIINNNPFKIRLLIGAQLHKLVWIKSKCTNWTILIHMDGCCAWISEFQLSPVLFVCQCLFYVSK